MCKKIHSFLYFLLSFQTSLTFSDLDCIYNIITPTKVCPQLEFLVRQY